MTHDKGLDVKGAFGITDRLSAHCGCEMHVVRRLPDAVLGPSYEKQVLECIHCGDHLYRVVDINGVEV